MLDDRRQDRLQVARVDQVALGLDRFGCHREPFCIRSGTRR
jgi:hypothetical protein